MAGRTAGPIKTKLGIGTHVDPGSILVNVKVIYRGPQGRDNRSSMKRDKYGGQRSARAERIDARRTETTSIANRDTEARRAFTEARRAFTEARRADTIVCSARRTGTYS